MRYPRYVTGRYITLLVVLALLLVSCAPEPTPEPTVTSVPAAPSPTSIEIPTQTTAPTEEPIEPIVIGLSCPLSGPISPVGQHQLWGVQLALKEINAEGGVLGRPIELKYEDNACNPSEGIKAATKLLDEGIVAFLGAYCSSVTLAVMPLFEVAKVPELVNVSTSAEISRQAGIGGNEWVFRSNPSDATMASAVPPILVAEDINTVSIVAEDTDFGRGAAEEFVRGAEASGVQILSQDFFPQGTTDFTTLLTRIINLDPDGVAVYILGGDNVSFLRQYVSFGVDAPLVGRPFLDAVYDELVVTGDLDGAMGILPYSNRIDTPENMEFVEKFQAEYEELPVDQSYEGYTATYILADAIERAGSSDPAAIRDALEETKFEDMKGGLIEFDEYNQGHPKAVLIRVEDGEIVVVRLVDT